jgi:purine-cytosine permease-like protein
LTCSAHGFIERRSIDYVPIAERHGKVWHLWPVWFSGDAHLATVATGVAQFGYRGALLVWGVALIAYIGWRGLAAYGAGFAAMILFFSTGIDMSRRIGAAHSWPMSVSTRIVSRAIRSASTGRSRARFW